MPSPLRASTLATLALVAGLPARALAQEGQGYAELRAATYVGASGDRWQLVERLRPTLETAFGDRLKLVATIEAGLAEGRDLGAELRRTLDESGFAPVLDALGCRWPAPASTLFRVSRASDYLAVDRLYLDWYGEQVDVRVGRQALHWGSAQFFNPTDPFPEVLLTEPWRPRAGVNAARAHVALSSLSDVTAIAALDDSLTKPRAALRVRTNRAGIDAAVSGAWRGDAEWLAGLDLRGTAVVGWWVEAAVHPTTGKGVHEELAAGVDYSFPVLERLIVMAQYYRNGAGETDPDRYDRVGALAGVAGPTCAGPSPLGATATDAFAPFTLARDYLLVSAALQVLPDLSLTVPLLQNLDDGSAVVIPTASWAALDWLDVSLSAQVSFATWGRGGELAPREGDLVFRSPLGPSVDLSGLVPDATLTLWTRASF